MNLQAEAFAYFLRSATSVTLINGDVIKMQDGKWWRFQANGSSVTAGFDTLSGLLMALTQEPIEERDN